MEFYIKNSKLIPQKEWENLIDSFLKADSGELQKALTEAIKKRIPQTRFGILFSGGVDSSFITAVCRRVKADFVCYTAGTKNSPDIKYARIVAKYLGITLKVIELDLANIENLAGEVIEITGRHDIVTVGVGVVVLACIKNAPEQIFFTGLGSEEIFAGYERHEKARDINNECKNGLIQMRERDLMRDIPIAEKNDATLLTPFLDADVIASAMKIKGEDKIRGGIKKFILRTIAERYLGEFAWRKKIAAQYGSGVVKALDKLAKINGFKYKKDYLTSLL